MSQEHTCSQISLCVCVKFAGGAVCIGMRMSFTTFPLALLQRLEQCSFVWHSDTYSPGKENEKSLSDWHTPISGPANMTSELTSALTDWFHENKWLHSKTNRLAGILEIHLLTMFQTVFPVTIVTNSDTFSFHLPLIFLNSSSVPLRWPCPFITTWVRPQPLGHCYWQWSLVFPLVVTLAAPHKMNTRIPKQGLSLCTLLGRKSWCLYWAFVQITGGPRKGLGTMGFRYPGLTFRKQNGTFVKALVAFFQPDSLGIWEAGQQSGRISSAVTQWHFLHSERERP